MRFETFQPDSEPTEPERGSQEELSQLPEVSEAKEEMSPEQKYEMARDFVFENLDQVKKLHYEISRIEGRIPQCSGEDKKELQTELKGVKQQLASAMALGRDNLQDLLVTGEEAKRVVPENVVRFIKQAAGLERVIRKQSKDIRKREIFAFRMPPEFKERDYRDLTVGSYNEKEKWDQYVIRLYKNELDRNCEKLSSLQGVHLQHNGVKGVPRELVYLDKAEKVKDNDDQMASYEIMGEWL